jgi:UDP-N-acetylglucosamine 4,6-dehydratase
VTKDLNTSKDCFPHSLHGSPAVKPGSLNTYLISGGTGSLGTLLTHQLIGQGHKVRAYARNEHSHENLIRSIPEEKRHLLSCLVGAVEDTDRLRVALRGVDYLVHAAAMKIIGLAEYNPSECVKTNVLGTESVIQAVLTSSVKRAVFVSSDKASASVNHYGHTKAVGEKLWLHANRYRPDDPPFVAVRYGNCWNSRGSVIQAFRNQITAGHLTVTSPECTRFHWKLEDAGAFVLDALHRAAPGEMWIPKLPSYKLDDLAHAFMHVHSMHKAFEVVGLRPGEKLHESMISGDEAFMSRDDGMRYVLTPGVAQGISTQGYNSGSNKWRIGRKELESLVEETCDV